MNCIVCKTETGTEANLHPQCAISLEKAREVKDLNNSKAKAAGKACCKGGRKLLVGLTKLGVKAAPKVKGGFGAIKEFSKGLVEEAKAEKATSERSKKLDELVDKNE